MQEQGELFEARQRLITYRKPKRDRIAENRAALELGRGRGRRVLPGGSHERVRSWRNRATRQEICSSLNH